MSLGLKAVLLAATVFLAGTAAADASAQTLRPKGSLASEDGRFGLNKPQRSIQWNEKGRWSVNLNVEEPVGRDVTKDVEAGAFFRIAPQLKVGGSLRMQDKLARPERLRPEKDREPQVRLETKFNF